MTGGARRDAGALRRNIWISAFGTAARGVQIAVLFLVGRMFGPAALGQFLLGFGLHEIATGVVATGLTDGTTLLVSRRAARSGAPLDVVATALLVGVGIATLIAALVTAAAPALAHLLTGPYRALLPSLPWLAWSLVPTAIARVAFAACTGLSRLEWEAIVGGAGPAVGLVLALPIVRWTGAGVTGLFAALTAVQVVMALVALAALGPWVGFRELWAALRRPRLDRALLRFALPQGVNMALTTFVGRLDLVLLAACGVPAATVGVYGAVAAVVRELRQTRTVVSGALAPIVARHDAAGDRAAVASALARSARGVAAVAVPLALGFVVVRRDVLALVAPGYTGETRFVLILLVGALVNCLGGLAGNFMIYLLRNRWNLANALVGALLGSVLGWLLIPRLGLTGAALAASAAAGAMTLLENLELAVLEGVRITARALRRALATLAVGAAGLAALGALGIAHGSGMGTRVAGAVVVTVAAALALRGRSRSLGGATTLIARPG